VEFKESEKEIRKIICLRCNVPLKFAGKYKFHEGFNPGIFGSFFELFVNREAFDLYVCDQCGKV
jgi:hypothetical protein